PVKLLVVSHCLLSVVVLSLSYISRCLLYLLLLNIRRCLLSPNISHPLQVVGIVALLRVCFLPVCVTVCVVFVSMLCVYDISEWRSKNCSCKKRKDIDCNKMFWPFWPILLV